VEVLKIFI